MGNEDLRVLLSTLVEFGVASYEWRDMKLTFHPSVPVQEVFPSRETVEVPDVRSDGLTAQEQVELYGKELP